MEPTATPGSGRERDADVEAWREFVATPPAEPKAPRRKLDLLGWAAIGVVVLALAGIALLWPTGEARETAALGTIGVPSELYPAEIVAADQQVCPGATELMCTSVQFRIDGGPDSGEIYIQDFPPSELNPEFTIGATAILSRRTPNGRVVGVGTAPCVFDPELECRLLTVQVEGTGPEPTTIDYIASNEEPAARLGVGDEAIVELFPGEDVAEALGVTPPDVQLSYQFTGDFQRRSLLALAAVLFAGVVIAVGLIRGFAALGGIVASLGILLLFILPAILDGRSPVLVAIVGATAISIVTLYLAHGFTRMTNVALLGIFTALVLTALLAAVGVELARFSGFASEESTLLTLFEGIDVRGLLLAGIVLGTAGALDDVAITQASAVWELAEADPGSDRQSLFRRAMRIGRHHIASTVNTLLLAYAGAALPLLILFVLSEQSLGAIANSEVVAVEIIRTLVGSIGLVAAVPLTTWLAARTAVGSPPSARH